MLPYYSGLLVNLSKVKKSAVFKNRNKFQGTLHQYIGTLWNVALVNNGLIKFFAKPMIYISFNDCKTWTDAMKELITVGIPNFYKLLLVPNDIQNDLLTDMQNRTRNWK